MGQQFFFESLFFLAVVRQALFLGKYEQDKKAKPEETWKASRNS